MMKKKIGMFIVFLILGALAGIGTGAILENASVELQTDPKGIGLALLAFALALYVQIYIHELGHLLFGRLTGFQFVSFRIGSVLVKRNEEGALALYKYSLPGTGGQCLMFPPETMTTSAIVLYNMGGAIMNILTALLAAILLQGGSDSYFPKIFLTALLIMGILSALLNGIPLKISGQPNDGYNMLQILKDAVAREAFQKQLAVNGYLSDGIRLRDMDPELFELPEGADMNNLLISTVTVSKVSYLLDQRKFSRGKELSEELLRGSFELFPIHAHELRLELLFQELINGNDINKVEGFLTKEMKAYLKSTESFPSHGRTLYAYELLGRHDHERAQEERRKFEKACLTFPYGGDVEGERELVEMIDQIHRQIHPHSCGEGDHL